MSSLDVRYYPITLYTNQIEKTPQQNGYLKMSFQTKANTPNIVIGESEYVSTNLYIFDKVHYGLQIDHDAVMIIEHSSITNDFQTLYLCIPLLESKEGTHNELELLIDADSASGSIDINISNFLSVGEKCVVYENEGISYNDYVIVATQPIRVKSDLINFNTKPTMLSDYNPNDLIQTIVVSSVVRGSSPIIASSGAHASYGADASSPVVEGMSSDVPMICTQIVEEGGDVQYEPVLQLSGTGGAAADSQNKAGFIYFRIVIQILFVILVSVVLVPTVLLPQIKSINAVLNVQQSACSFFYLAFLILSVITIGIGFGVNQNANEAILGIFMLVMVLISRYMTNKMDDISGFSGLSFLGNIESTGYMYILGAFLVSGIIPAILFSQKQLNIADFFIMMLYTFFLFFFILIVSKMVKVK